MTDGFDSFVADFALEAQERCERIEELLLAALERDPSMRDDLLEDARRELHTLKGNAGMVGLRDLQTAAHVLEDKIEVADLRDLLHELDDYRTLLNAVTHADDAASERTAQTLRAVRVPFSALDELVDLLAEMVVFRNRLDDAIVRGAHSGADEESWRDVMAAHDALGKTLALLQDHIMAVRMVPLRMLFGQLRRIVHDECAAANKEAHLIAVGGDTPMDKALLESASESLGHLVRNAVTHGIEAPQARAAAGKRREGTVQISATTQSHEVWIEVVDDGGGIDPQVVLREAQRRGIAIDDDPLRLLFHAGLSTRSDSDISAGRGMGLSAALEAVRRVGGDIEIESTLGRGTRFRIRLPLTLSITRAMLVRADTDEYAIPLSAIVESIRVNAGDVHIVNDAAVLNWRGHVVPLLDLGLVMSGGERTSRPHIGDERTRTSAPHGYIVIITADGKTRGLLVDELIGMREIVVKGLGDIGSPPPGISGATILGDGRVLLIADPKSLVAMSPMLHGVGQALSLSRQGVAR